MAKNYLRIPGSLWRDPDLERIDRLVYAELDYSSINRQAKMGASLIAEKIGYTKGSRRKVKESIIRLINGGYITKIGSDLRGIGTYKLSENPFNWEDTTRYPSTTSVVPGDYLVVPGYPLSSTPVHRVIDSKEVDSYKEKKKEEGEKRPPTAKPPGALINSGLFQSEDIGSGSQANSTPGADFDPGSNDSVFIKGLATDLDATQDAPQTRVNGPNSGPEPKLWWITLWNRERPSTPMRYPSHKTRQRIIEVATGFDKTQWADFFKWLNKKQSLNTKAFTPSAEWVLNNIDSLMNQMRRDNAQHPKSKLYDTVEDLWNDRPSERTLGATRDET